MHSHHVDTDRLHIDCRLIAYALPSLPSRSQEMRGTCVGDARGGASGRCNRWHVQRRTLERIARASSFVRNQSAINMLPIHNQYAINMQSICNRHATNMRSICDQYATNMLPICYQYAINMQSICNHYAINMQSICNQYAISLHTTRRVPRHHDSG